MHTPTLSRTPAPAQYSHIRFVSVVSRRLLQPNDTEAAAADAHAAAKHHIPHVQVSARVRRLVLPERCDVFYGENRRFAAVQLRVSVCLTCNNNES